MGARNVRVGPATFSHGLRRRPGDCLRETRFGGRNAGEGSKACFFWWRTLTLKHGNSPTMTFYGKNIFLRVV